MGEIGVMRVLAPEKRGATGAALGYGRKMVDEFGALLEELALQDGLEVC